VSSRIRRPWAAICGEVTKKKHRQDIGSSNHSDTPEDPNNTVEKNRGARWGNGAGSARHRSDTHPGNPEDIKNTVEKTEVPRGETTLVTEEASKRSRSDLSQQGYTIKQLTSQFGFSETTIRQEIAKVVRPEGEAIDDKAKQQDNVWPVVRKMGGGMEVISPEAVLRQYMGGGTPEEQLELRAIMKFRAAMLMVMDLVNVQKGSAEADAKRMEPILRAHEGDQGRAGCGGTPGEGVHVEIADKAAYETAAQLSQVNSPEQCPDNRLDKPDPAGHGRERGESARPGPELDAVHAADEWGCLAYLCRVCRGTGRRGAGGAVAAAGDYAPQAY